MAIAGDHEPKPQTPASARHPGSRDHKPHRHTIMEFLLVLVVVTLGSPVAVSAQTTSPTATATKTATPYPTATLFPCNAPSYAGMTWTYADLHRWNSEILQVHNATGVPANVIKSIMWVESRGALDARSPLTSSGYYFGLMQIGSTSAVPSHMKSVSWMCGNAYNQVLAGGTELVNKANAIGTYQWDLVAGAYFGYGTDVTGTTTSGYMAQFRAHLNALSGTTPGASDWSLPVPTATPVTTASPVGTVSSSNFAIGSTVEVAVAQLNVRAGAGVGWSVLRIASSGDTMTILSQPTPSGGYDWYQVRLQTGTTAWVAGDFLRPSTSSSTPVATQTPTSTATPLPTQTPAATSTNVPTQSADQFATGDSVIVAVSRLNMRSSSSLSAGVVTVLARGSTGQVTGSSVVNGSYTWAPVDFGTLGSGWVATTFLDEAVTNTATMTPTPLPLTSTPTRVIEPTTSPSETAQSGTGGIAGGRYEVDVFALNLRSAPALAAPVVSVLARGDELISLDGRSTADGYTWIEVSTASNQGWVASRFLDETAPPPTTTPTSTSTPTATATSTQTATPTSTSTPVPTSTPQSYDTSFTNGDEVATSVFALNFRSGPGTTSSVIAVLSFGSTGTVLGGPIDANGYAWYQIATVSQGTGWVASSFIQKTGVANAAPNEESQIPTEAVATEPAASTDPTIFTDETSLPASNDVETPTLPASHTPAPADTDADGIIDALDQCPGVHDTGFDSDGDGIDDGCDPTPLGEPTPIPPQERSLVSLASTNVITSSVGTGSWCSRPRSWRRVRGNRLCHAVDRRCGERPDRAGDANDSSSGGSWKRLRVSRTRRRHRRIWN